MTKPVMQEREPEAPTLELHTTDVGAHLGNEAAGAVTVLPKRDVAAPSAIDGSSVPSLVEYAIKAGAGIDTIERLVAMQERAEDRAALRAYNEALAEMQGELPVIERHGKITIRDKNNEAVIKQSTPYALWEDINEAIKPVLHKNGFALTFRNGTTPEGKITVTGILKHRDGHQEETTMILPHDTTGSKNAVQAVGSSTSYGKRYTASALLNLTSRGEDDDGKAGGGKPASEPETITVQQAELIRERIVALGSNVQRFMERAGVDKLEHLSVADYKDAMRVLDQRESAARNKPATPRDQVRNQLQDSVSGATR